MIKIGEYEILRNIGSGSNATVYKVRHIRDGYIRALKELTQPIDSIESPAYQKFMEECRTLFRIGSGGHPNIVRMSNPQLINYKAVVEMDYIDGVSLKDYLERNGVLPIDEVMRFAHEIVGAMAFCHRDVYQFMMDPSVDALERDMNNGSQFHISKEKEKELIAKYQVIHNDLHSNNIMRRNYDGRYILLDFGLAIQNNDCVKSSSRRHGAPEYMAPEKSANKPITPASDVYSLGILLYEMLTGSVPFPEQQRPDESIEAAIVRVQQQHATETVPDARKMRQENFNRLFPDKIYKDDIPQQFIDLIYKCLEKKPENRFNDAYQVYQNLKNIGIPASQTTDSDEVEYLRDELNKTQRELKTLNASLKIFDADADDSSEQLSRLEAKISVLTHEKETALRNLWSKDAQLNSVSDKLINAENNHGKLVICLVGAALVIGFLLFKLLTK